MTTTKLNNKIRNIVPPQVEAALLHRHGQYTDMVDIFHCIQLDTDCWVGVAGDGANGSYEHFCYEAGVLECFGLRLGNDRCGAGGNPQQEGSSMKCPKCGHTFKAANQVKGGKSRWTGMSKAQRKQAASDAAKARWAKRPNGLISRAGEIK